MNLVKIIYDLLHVLILQQWVLRYLVEKRLAVVTEEVNRAAHFLVVLGLLKQLLVLVVQSKPAPHFQKVLDFLVDLGCCQLLAGSERRDGDQPLNVGV